MDQNQESRRHSRNNSSEKLSTSEHSRGSSSRGGAAGRRTTSSNRGGTSNVPQQSNGDEGGDWLDFGANASFIDEEKEDLAISSCEEEEEENTSTTLQPPRRRTSRDPSDGEQQPRRSSGVSRTKSGLRQRRASARSSLDRSCHEEGNTATTAPRRRSSRDASDGEQKQPRSSSGLSRTKSEVRQRGAPTRSLSERRGALTRTHSMRNQGQVEGDDNNTSTTSPPITALTRAHSRRRQPPSRSHSEILPDTDRVHRRESMKALYRVKNEEELSNISSHGGGAGDAAATSRRSGLGADPVRRGSLTAATTTEEQAARRAQRRPSSLEGGPLSGVVDRQPPSRPKSISDGLAAEGGDGGATDSAKWLKRRASRQDEIMTLAHTVKERFEEDRMEQDHQHLHQQLAGAETDTRYYGSDDDQPMAMRNKKTVMEQLSRVVTKTAGVTKSAAKGSRNAVLDPKRAAKRVGHLSKDVGKATIKTVLDPKKAAINVGKVTKNVTVGSAKVGAGITKGVGKGTFRATKTVVKGSMGATKTVAKGTVKGAGKVVKSTARVIKGKEKSSHSEDNYETYDAKHMASRNKSNFFDRISQLVETSESSTGSNENGEKAAPPVPQKAASILMMTNIVGAGSGTWDV
jgi:hypothetical protein